MSTTENQINILSSVLKDFYKEIHQPNRNKRWMMKKNGNTYVFSCTCNTIAITNKSNKVMTCLERYEISHEYDVYRVSCRLSYYDRNSFKYKGTDAECKHSVGEQYEFSLEEVKESMREEAIAVLRDLDGYLESSQTL